MAKRPALRGDKELRRNLRRLTDLYSGPVLDDAIQYALTPLELKVQSNARKMRDYPGKWPTFPTPATPPRGGHLDEGVASRRVYGSKKKRTWWTGMTKRARKLAHLVEFGTKPHFQKRFRGGFNHPGARPSPFFRPAFESSKHEVLGRFSRRVQVVLYRATARMRT